MRLRSASTQIPLARKTLILLWVVLSLETDSGVFVIRIFPWSYVSAFQLIKQISDPALIWLSLLSF